MAKKSLLEVEYKDIFSPKTLATLKGKSGESLQQMLGDKTLTQSMMRSQELITELMRIEAPYKDLLEQLAIDMVSEAYPIIDHAGIKIEAKLNEELKVSDVEPEEEPEEDELELPPGIELPSGEPPEDVKRRIINGITHGSAIRGSFGYLLFREYLDRIDDTLVDKYGEILKNVFGMYDDDEAIAMMLAMLQQGSKIEGGESEAEYNEEEDTFTIKANALVFPMLVHEIVKGLYEILSLQGFSTDTAQNKATVQRVDKIGNEPEDLRYGKFIYDAINDLYAQSGLEDPRIREFLFVEIYKLSEEEFMSFIDNAVNGELTQPQKLWAQDTMHDINSDLKKDDTGLSDVL